MTIVLNLLACALLGMMPGMMAAQERTAEEILTIDLSLEVNRELDIEDYHWANRVIIVFSDSPFNPNYIEQLNLLEEDAAVLAERDVIVMIDSDPTVESKIRKEFRPLGFALVAIGKDGRIFLRKPTPWNLREISRAIDKLPIRQQELRSR